jgi:Lrp/AsnC family leucine-responsive transcriptional regulator
MTFATQEEGASGRRQRRMRVTEVDRQILSLLEQDARRTVSDMAQRVGASRTAVKDRMMRLQEAGIIKRFTVDIERDAVETGPLGSAFLLVRLHRASCKSIHEAIRGWPEVLGCWSIAGDLDMIILVSACSSAELENLRDRLARNSLIKSLTTLSVLREWMHRPAAIAVKAGLRPLPHGS